MKRPMLFSFVTTSIFLFWSATLSAQMGGMGSPGMAYGGTMGMGGMGSGMPGPSLLEQATTNLHNAKSKGQRDKYLGIVKTELSKEYDQYLAYNKQQIEAMQKRLDRLKDQLEKRVQAKDELLSLEVKRILNESQGLAWPTSRNSGSAYGGGGMGGGGGFGGGFGGGGGGRPDFAQAGGKDASALDDALAKGAEVLREGLGG